MLEWMPLIGDLPFWKQMCWLMFATLPVVFVSYIVSTLLDEPYLAPFDRLAWENDLRAPRAIALWASTKLYFASSLAAVLFFVLAALGGLFTITNNLADLAEKNGPPIAASRVEIDPDWDREFIEIRCPESEISGQVELLGNKTATSFRVEAVRIRTDRRSTDLSMGAGIEITERHMWRSSTPSVSVEGLRADGTWQSRYTDGPFTLARGQQFLLNATLGSVKEGNGWNGEPHDEEQECWEMMVSF